MPRMPVVIVILAIGIVFGYSAQNNTGAGTPEKWPGFSSSEKTDLSKPAYTTESEWIAGSVAADIAEMTATALKQPVPNVAVRTQEPDQFVVTVQPWGAGKLTAEVKFSGSYAWSPAAFMPLASALLGEYAGKAKLESSDTTLPMALLEPVPEVLVKEDLRVSKALNENLLSPGNHEQVALIISALALRESAKSFSDLRHLLCRLSAHLTLARALRSAGSAGSSSGLWAEASLLALVGRAADSMAVAENIKSGSADDAWRKALAFRNTGDWRNFRKTASTSLLELREWFHASVERHGSLAALESLRDSKIPNVADWSRLLLSHSYPVDIANSVAPAAVNMEVNETMSVYKAYTASDLPDSKWVSELNGTGNRCIRYVDGKNVASVLGWANWTPFLRRQLLMALFEEVYSLNRMLAIREDAQETVSGQDRTFTGLRDYWQVRLARSNTESSYDSLPPLVPAGDVKAICAQAAAAIKEYPALISASFWDASYNKCISERTRGVIPGPEKWFNPVLPAGTIFNFDETVETNLRLRLKLADYEKMYVLKPRNYAVAYEVAITRFGNRPAPEKVEGIFGPLLDYDSRAIRQLIWMADTYGADSGKYRERACDMEPDECIGTGEYFSTRGDEERAIKVFERGFEKARDPLSLANSADWPVDYYLDRGRRKDAFRFANYAADVYSGDGLLTMARYMERLGRYNDAVSWYRKVAERYESEGEIRGFYIRYQQRIGDERFAQESADALKKMFPNGLEKVAFSDFSNPPNRDDGFKVTARILSPRNRGIGLRSGDLIVAVDGYRVHNMDQWVTVRSLRDDPMLSLIVWRGNGYVQLNGRYVRDKYCLAPPAEEK